MSTKNFLADGARLINGLGGMVAGARGEIDQAMKNKLLAQMHEIGFVPRADFEACLELAQNSAIKIAELEKRLITLEEQLSRARAQ